MASKPIPVRLRPVVVAYIDELERIGGYGEGRSGVIRRFIENGIAREIKRNVIPKKNAADFGESVED
jgi:hypothetical protein